MNICVCLQGVGAWGYPILFFWGGSILLYTETRKSFSIKVTGNQRPKTCEGVNHAAIWQQGVQGIENKKCKGP